VLLRVFFVARLRLVAFFDDTDVGFVVRRVVGFLTVERGDATLFFETDLADGGRFTDEVVFLADEVVFFCPAFFFAVPAREALAVRGVDAFAPAARPRAFTRARLVVRVAAERARLRPTMLRTPGPGIRLVCSPVFQRTVSIAPFTDVTTPARGPDLDVTSTRSPTTAIRSSSRKSARVCPNERLQRATWEPCDSWPAVDAPFFGLSV
jgi:hypothetical protein